MTDTTREDFRNILDDISRRLRWAAHALTDFTDSIEEDDHDFRLNDTTLDKQTDRLDETTGRLETILAAVRATMTPNGPYRRVETNAPGAAE